ncbi:hypothetical protein TNCV_5136421 [Trichonephila clavipes]|nr:hypothetical protein TNCV_5136421 [Trichonephila clavipes]
MVNFRPRTPLLEKHHPYSSNQKVAVGRAGEACIKRILSSRLVLREWDNRNRWCDGQVCPDVGQGIMAPWSRRPGYVFGCYGQIGLGGRERLRWPNNEKGREACCGPTPGVLKGFFSGYERKKPCPGSRELERRALVGTDWKRALEGENLRRALKKGTWSEIGVERKERR